MGRRGVGEGGKKLAHLSTQSKLPTPNSTLWIHWVTFHTTTPLLTMYAAAIQKDEGKGCLKVDAKLLHLHKTTIIKT